MGNLTRVGNKLEGSNKMKKYRLQEGIFHKTAGELREFTKENDIKLLRLLKYLRRRNDKKIQKENCLNVKNNT